MDTQKKGNVCTMCSHEHKADGTCDCDCGMKKENESKMCTMCGLEHKKAGGSRDCGCGTK